MTDDPATVALELARDRLQQTILQRDLANRRLAEAIDALRGHVRGLGDAGLRPELAATWDRFEQEVATVVGADAAEKAARREEYAAFKSWQTATRRRLSSPAWAPTGSE